MIEATPSAPVLAPAAMRAAEAGAVGYGVPALRLMERAAAGAGAAIRAFASPRSALVLCGPGNNGGDGYGVALALRAAGVDVRVAATGPARNEPAATLALRWHAPVEPLTTTAASPLVVDALFGTGLARPIPNSAQTALDRLRGTARTVIALDIASGVDAETGVLLGRPLPADMTIAFGALKPGHLLGPGAALAGRLVVADIGVPVASDLGRVQRPRLASLPRETHKYARGAVLVVAGTRAGAARLTALAALRAGAGLVTLAGESGPLPAEALMTTGDAGGAELLSDPRVRAVVVGPGLADDSRSRAWVSRVMRARVPTVLDAAAIAMAASAEVAAPLLLTPHEGEFMRTFGPIGPDRVGAVRAAAAASGAVVLLKGAATIIAAPDGRAAICDRGVAWLATAGSGDVLAGVAGALLAQGLAPFDAACAAAWLHGEAGRRLGPGGIADDLPGLLPGVLADL